MVKSKALLKMKVDWAHAWTDTEDRAQPITLRL